jgi:hypothetical protein
MRKRKKIKEVPTSEIKANSMEEESRTFQYKLKPVSNSTVNS